MNVSTEDHTGSGDTAPAWAALAAVAEAADGHLPDDALAALICAAHGVAPGGMGAPAGGGPPSGAALRILDASGRTVWSGHQSACPDVSASGALDLLTALLPGWTCVVDEDEDDGSAEAVLRAPGDPDDPVQGTGATLALAVTAALCRAMARLRERQAARNHRFRQERALRSLAGSQVMAATVCEMAFWDPGPDSTCVFEDARFPFVQGSVLELALGGGVVVRVSTWMDEVFALDVALAEPSLSSAREEPGSIWRERILPDFPTGPIDGVDWWADAEGRIQEVSLRIAGRPVFLRAGEVEERGDRAAVIRDRDESVLIFLDREAYAATPFNVLLPAE